jgi:hypothetical protein
MTTHTTIKTTRHGQLPRQWFRTVLRDYERNGGWLLCGSSETFQFAWIDATSRDYLCKLAIRFCVSHRPNFYAGDVFLFNSNSPASDDARIAVRTAFLRWCIASTANRTA